jgi:hypothetical protein
MNDPWKDIRKWLRSGGYNPPAGKLLADADVLLAVKRIADRHMRERVHMPPEDPVDLEFESALAALPEHLKEQS